MDPFTALALFRGFKQSGQLEGIPLLDKLGEIVGDKDASPLEEVNAAVAILVKHAPQDEQKAGEYLKAIASAVNAATTLRRALA